MDYWYRICNLAKSQGKGQEPREGPRAKSKGPRAKSKGQREKGKGQIAKDQGL
jgi:hypothetical protein